ncbi:hypothetical protein B0H10DRAFT_2160321 [Mycena sp. CBHHK59/15]|nr:hypothetical protein B0H10DRAFT_2160321 [Mycena sp. CBHHK59/15]
MYRERLASSGDRVWSNLMSGDWAWKQADIITEDPDNHGCAFVPVVAGSDKTTFCRQMYHASLARIFKPLKANMTTPDIVCCPDGHFHRVIYGLGPYIADYLEQVWLAGIAHPDHLDAEGARLRTKTKTDTLIMCFDPGILWDDYGIRSDIVPYTHDFPRADIHELLSSDLLHQVIKGTFKDHLVAWVNEYLFLEHGEARALEIIQDIDRRISAVPEFPGLRRFPDGRDFSQWTGDDSKALMKAGIYLGAVAGYLPSDMVKALSAFMDFCYLVRRNTISTPDLTSISNIFIQCGVRIDISLPRQHSLVHYLCFIHLFGSPNGLCSSITESKHIKAAKEPWRRSSRYNALAQMLVTLSRLDKLAAARCEFASRGMMTGTTSSYTAMVLAGDQPQVTAMQAAANVAADKEDIDDDDRVVHGPRSLSDIELAPMARTSSRLSIISERGYPKYLEDLAAHIGQPRLPLLLRRFLHAEVHGPPAAGAAPPPLDTCPVFEDRITVHHSVIARFYAPSDLGGAGGMYCERIRSNPKWHGYARCDTVLVDVGGPVMKGLVIGRAMLFFSFTFGDKEYQCALVHWIVPVGETPDPDTGMWVVEPEFEAGSASLEVINIDAIALGCHLIGVYGTSALPEDFHFSSSLDAFNTYFVNQYADHHMEEFLA